MTFSDDAMRWWHSLTVWFGSALVVIGAVVEYLAASQPDLTPFLGRWGGAVTVAIGVVNVLLRLRTSRPIGRPAIKAGGTD
jgi:hypothetical protein